MQKRFRMFRRAGGNFYSRDKITGRSESLGTSDRTQARQLLAARNQAAAQPQLNRTMAKAYLSAKPRSSTAEQPSASKPNRPIEATAEGGLEAKRCPRMRYPFAFIAILRLPRML